MECRDISEEKELFKCAMKGEWNTVISIYENDPSVHVAQIIRSGDTALHIAVFNAQEAVVEQLVDLVSACGEPRKALETRNVQGNTPLHVAASLGNVRMCLSIVRVDHSLLEIQNNAGETPLFVAALHGKKEAFLCLNSYCQTQEEGYSYCRRKDDENVLHCAIAGDYFDLAFQIIYLYQDLVNHVNKNGISALHLLASNPTAFRSGSHLGRFNQLIYHCIIVEPLKVEPSFQQSSSYVQSKESKERMMRNSCPGNYQTCMHLLHLLKQLVQVVTKSSENTSKGGDPVGNLEDPNVASETVPKGHKRRHGDGHQFLPPNYVTFIDFVKLLSKAMLVILGLGSRRIRKLREKKQTHTWAVQIMNELLQHVSMYQYEETEAYLGCRPQHETKRYEITKGGDVKTLASSAKRETPILIAAKSGITEMVDEILQRFPVVIHETNTEKKNIVLLAVENRQPHVYELLLKKNIMKDSVFRAVDHNGNSALHLAAMLGDHRPWLIPGAALQMQWEIKCANRDRGIRHIDHGARWCEVGERNTHLGEPSGIRRVRHLIPHHTVLLRNGGGDVLIDTNVSVSRDGFPHRFATEAFAGVDVAVRVDSVGAGVVLSGTFLHFERQVEVRSVPGVCGDLPACDALCHSAVSSLP
ncbi:hypothetical protein V6N12_044614 [Hibiscus sabdariffa]|uniref:Uncharacterized protein n=1 Tax=Hibiscus sabdariffa TaxID=183260 RepID=A0ABR2AXB6_9ROSI